MQITLSILVILNASECTLTDLIFQPLLLQIALWYCPLLFLSLLGPQSSEKYWRFMIVKLIYTQTLVVVLLHPASLCLYCCMHECMWSHYQWTAIFLQLVVFWCLPVLLFTPFSFFNVITHLSNINTTGKKRPGCKEGYRRHGSARDQIRRHGLLHHACGNRTLAVLPGARCQIITFRTSEEEGELPLLYCGSARLSNKRQLSVIQKLH